MFKNQLKRKNILLVWRKNLFMAPFKFNGMNIGFLNQLILKNFVDLFINFFQIQIAIFSHLLT